MTERPPLDSEQSDLSNDRPRDERNVAQENIERRSIRTRKARLLTALHKLAPRGIEKTKPTEKSTEAPPEASAERRVSIYG